MRPKPIKFIATFSDFYGTGDTPDIALERLSRNVLDYDGDDIKPDDCKVYEIQRIGKARLVFDWESK